jgi:predicted adenine nucleotide alpha hydrolase (AANH) superfamily ATPase
MCLYCFDTHFHASAIEAAANMTEQFTVHVVASKERLTRSKFLDR